MRVKAFKSATSHLAHSSCGEAKHSRTADGIEETQCDGKIIIITLLYFLPLNTTRAAK